MFELLISLWSCLSELFRILFYYWCFNLAYKYAQPWSATHVNVFRQQQLKPGTNNKQHEWPGKYVSFVHAAWATYVCVGYATNLKEWDSVEQIVTVTAGFLLFEAVRVQRMYNDCRSVHSERRIELMRQERRRHKSGGGGIDRHRNHNNEIAVVKLPDPTHTWFHHSVTLLALYGVGMNETARNSVVLSYITGEIAILFQHLLWFARAACADRQHARSFPLWFALATVLHVITGVIYTFVRLPTFGYFGVKFILPNTHWLYPVPLVIPLALIALFVLNCYWCWLLVRNGESFAFCSIKSFDIQLQQPNDKRMRPHDKEHNSNVKRRRRRESDDDDTMEYAHDQNNDPDRRRRRTDDDQSGPIIHATE